MPLYTYIMSYKGVTKVSQHRFSNYTGFVPTPINAAFPELGPAFSERIWVRPVSVEGAKRTWTCYAQVSGERFTLHVVETRD